MRYSAGIDNMKSEVFVIGFCVLMILGIDILEIIWYNSHKRQPVNVTKTYIDNETEREYERP